MNNTRACASCRYEGVRKDLEEQSNQLHEEIKRLDADAADLNEECEIANGEIEELGFKLENFRMAIAKRNSNIEDIKRGG